MRNLLLVLGLLALAIGLLWIGQGTGMITWPASSFMIRQIEWAGYGAALAGLGLVLIWQSKRSKPRYSSWPRLVPAKGHVFKAVAPAEKDVDARRPSATIAVCWCALNERTPR